MIINLQQTPYDDVCSLRLFCKADEAMAMLEEELGLQDAVAQLENGQHQLQQQHAHCLVEDQEDVFRIPFDSNGSPIGTNAPLDDWSILDLRAGESVKLTAGPYSGDVGVVTGKNAAGHYSIRISDSIHPTFNTKRRPFTLWMGSWWIGELCNGHSHGCPEGGLCPCVSVGAASLPAATTAESIRKYLRMSRIGVPLQAIRCSMAADGLSLRTASEYIRCGDMEARERQRVMVIN